MVSPSDGSPLSVHFTTVAEPSKLNVRWSMMLSEPSVSAWAAMLTEEIVKDSACAGRGRAIAIAQERIAAASIAKRTAATRRADAADAPLAAVAPRSRERVRASPDKLR